MSIREAALSSLRLLDTSSQRRLIVVSVIQMATSFLDLIGVALLGLVGALAVTVVQGVPAPPVVDSVALALGLESLSDEALLAVLSISAAALLLSKSLLSTVLIRRIFLFLASRQAAVSSRLSRELLSRPLTFVYQRSSQQTAYALVQGAASATLVMLGQAVIFVSEASLLILLGALLLFVDPVVAISSIVYFALVAVALQLVLGKWATRAGADSAEADIASLEAIQEAMSSYREITVLSRREMYVHRIQELRAGAAKHAADLQFIGAFPKYAFEVALVTGGIALAAVLFSTQQLVEAVGTLALFLAAATRVMPSILRLQGASLAMRNAAGSATATLELAESLGEPGYPGSFNASTEPVVPLLIATQYRDFTPDIELSEVTFTYPDAPRPAVTAVSLYAPPGSSVALVGASGAGKSTIADVVLGVLRPQSGEVRIGSMEPEAAVARWPGAISYVPQEVALANASVRANVALGLSRDQIDDEMVWEALARARLSEVIRNADQGLDTPVGERGLRLSGGQRQRLGIARALYTEPKLLILDEATSALDAETEVGISQTIQRLEGQVTTLIIAHRLSTIRNVDQVIYLDGGQIQANGSFEDVRLRVEAFDRQANLMGLT